MLAVPIGHSHIRLSSVASGSFVVFLACLVILYWRERCLHSLHTESGSSVCLHPVPCQTPLSNHHYLWNLHFVYLYHFSPSVSVISTRVVTATGRFSVVFADMPPLFPPFGASSNWILGRRDSSSPHLPSFLIISSCSTRYMS